ncbi:MAG: lipid-A-disaccharide synthase [Acidobacteria bacterium]|nr:lipid-A-disaccharide synthase [Acidobacteriota bacterium]
MVPAKILVSAGEASGDLYASQLVIAIRARAPETGFFGCAGPRLTAAGVCRVIDAGELSVVGLLEVVTHIPRIFRLYRRMVRVAAAERPDLAILTDSPDFHLRLATRLRRLGIPVVYLVAPQVWAWRKGRLRRMRRDLREVLCIFPFEEPFFRKHGVRARYIGHPLTRAIRPNCSKDEFFRKLSLDASRPLVVILPGSRVGEVERHLAALGEAARHLRASGAQLLLATPPGFSRRAPKAFFSERLRGSSIQVIEGETWDAIAHADLALAASGTVTMEAALLGTPMVTFYRVHPLSWRFGRFLVDVPFYSMVNLIAGRQVVPELIQDDLTGERLAAEANRLLRDAGARCRMKRDLAEVAAALATPEEPMECAARAVLEHLETR